MTDTTTPETPETTPDALTAHWHSVLEACEAANERVGVVWGVNSVAIGTVALLPPVVRIYASDGSCWDVPLAAIRTLRFPRVADRLVDAAPRGYNRTHDRP